MRIPSEKELNINAKETIKGITVNYTVPSIGSNAQPSVLVVSEKDVEIQAKEIVSGVSATEPLQQVIATEDYNEINIVSSEIVEEDNYDVHQYLWPHDYQSVFDFLSYNETDKFNDVSTFWDTIGLNVRPEVRELVHSSQQLQFYAYKALTDHPALYELISKYIDSKFKDNATVTDNVSKKPTKVVQESLGLSDTVYFLRNMFYSLYENTICTEVIRKTVSKTTVDTKSLVEQVLKQTTANKFDAIVSSDSVFKGIAANKVEPLTTSTVINKILTTIKQESLASAEQVLKQTATNKIESVVSSDNLLKSIVVNKIEALATSDAINKALITIKQENLALVEFNAKIVSKISVDSIHATELLSKVQGLNKKENIALTEYLNLLVSFNRAIVETTSTFDLLSWVMGDKYLDALGVWDDYVAINLSTKFSDTFSSIDTILKLTTKPFSESKVTSDSNIKTVGKGNIENLATNSILFFDTSTLKSDLKFVSELVQLSLAKTPVETISKVDSIVLLTNKNLSELTTSTDTIAKTSSSIKTELVGLSDNISLLLFTLKTFLDSITTSEIITKASNNLKTETVHYSETINLLNVYSRNLVEPISTYDRLSWVMGDKYLDTTTYWDNIYLTFSTGFSNTVSKSDSVYFTYGDKPTELVIASESLKRDFTKSLTESKVTSDIILKTYSDALQDSLTKSDIKLLTISKVSTETVSIATSGYTFLYSYAGTDYFSQDYVGTSSTF
jgi:hypothetical protein